MRYTLEDLREQFAAAVLDDAGIYMELAQVALPDIRQDGRLITSLVQVPGRRPYRVYTRIDRDGEQVPRIHGECSCSKRGNCEHVAAVLLRALAQAQEPAGETLEPARQGRCLDDPTADRPTLEVRQHLLYLLFPEAGDARALPLRTVSARALKSGGFDRLLDYRPEWAVRGRSPRFILPQDRRLLSELAHLRVGPEALMLQGKQGAGLLSRLLETGRCWLQQAACRLREGDPRAASFRWEMDQRGFQFPRFSLRPEAPYRMLLDTPWYIDPARGECGRWRIALPAILLERLFEFSHGVAPEHAPALNRTLAALAPDTGLPPLRELQVVRLRGLQPVPCLRLFSQREQTPWGDRPWLDRARLSFAYREHRVVEEGPVQWLDGERLVTLERDDAAEAAAADRLLDWGFREAASPVAEPGCYGLDGGPEAWFECQSELLPALRQAGWRIEFDDSFRFRLLEVEQWYGTLQPREETDWFRVGLGVQVEGERINLLPALVAALRGFPGPFAQARLHTLEPRQRLIVPLEDGRLVPVPIERMRLILDTLFELYQDASLDGRGELSLSRIQLARLAELFEGDPALQLCGGEVATLHQLVETLRGCRRLPAVAPPRGLQARLRDYQLQGLGWLQFLHANDLGGVLADDMGLGKTVQTLAHLLLEKEQGRLQRPALVVAPTSLLVNWRREARQFTPTLRVLLLHGPKRQQRFSEIPRHDLVLTSYPLLGRDRDTLLTESFHMLILDEAQQIKNPKTRAGRVVRELDARHRVCLTGTPLENHLGELWSLFDFLLPGLLGSDRQFRRSLRNPIEKQGDESASERLALRLRPFMLRRTKQQVVKELPAKTEILRTVALEGAQRDLYETIRLAMHEQVRKAVAEQGWERSRIMMLDALLKLRQVCCDPRLVKLADAREVKQSAKLELLMELLPEMVEEGRRILLFSQFTGMLNLIQAAVEQAGIDFVRLTGRTRDRAAPVDRFQRGEVPLFLISLKAGGTGLNLTAADTVIHYDPWWNPAVERQATDRAHRIGQNNPVFVYKLIGEDTVEEKIQHLQANKQALADSLFSQGGVSGRGWSEAEFELLFGALT